MNAVYDAAQYVDGTDPQYTLIDYKPGEARDFPVLLHGNVATPGEIVPRHFLTVLSKGDSTFKHGSGRLELAERYLHRRRAAGRARDRQSRVGLAFRHGRWSPPPAISACRAKSRRIRNCWTIWRRASSRMAGRSNG